MRAVKTRVRSLVWLVAATAAGVASASGPLGYDARFWYSHSPGPTTAEIVAGDLGILDLGQNPKLLIVAYRHLTELGVGPASQPKLLTALEEPERWAFESRGGVQSWLAERRRLPGATERSWLTTERAFERVEESYTWKEYRPNCLDDAFVTAARTLGERIAAHGLESAEVREWAAGQDRVFALCEEGEEPPPELDGTWPEWLRQDREYQIAAGHFYAFHHEEAQRRFAAIGRDTSSPWNGLAKYLVARTAMRAGDRAGAKLAIAEVLGDAALAELHPAARRLETLVAIRSQPALRRQELETRLLAPSFVDADPRELGQALTDFEWLVTGRVDGAGLPAGDLDTWLTVMLGSSPVSEVPADLAPLPSAAPRAIGFYREKRTLPWLVAALVTAQGGEPELPDLLAAAAVPDDSPAVVTLGFHRARLLLTRATPAADGEARELLDGLLRRPHLAPAVGNRLKFLRASLAATLDEYLRFSLVKPVEMGFDDGGSQLWPEDPAAPTPFVLNDEAVAHLNRSVPTRELARLAGHGELLPADWRQRIGLAAWVGAILEKDAAVAEGLVPVLRPVVPEALAGDLEAWLGAAGTEREFLAHLTFLRWPGLSPRLGDDVGRRTPLDEMDALRENGWCEKGGLLGAAELAPVRFLSAAVQQAAASDEPWPELQATVLEIGPAVIRYAEEHRDDPRVPEALHRVVRFTRVGCAWGDAVGEVSKRAFDLLHRRYPKSEWTAKTPYWFQG